MSNAYNLYFNRNDTLSKLMKVPMKDSKENTPTVDPSIEPHYVHQADLLYLPHDKSTRITYKYALVVVDIGSRLCDAEKLSNKNQHTVKRAFEAIYRRRTLSIPKALIQLDGGTEFKGVVRQYFKQNNVMVRISKPYRHRQQAVVEKYNMIIGRAIFYKQHTIHIRTGVDSTDWIADLPVVVNLINNHVRNKVRKVISPVPRCEDKTRNKECNLLKIGDRVYVISEVPRDAVGNRLEGRFRATDTRWEQTPRTITDISIQPYQPPLYAVSGADNKLVLYTKNQLQKI